MASFTLNGSSTTSQSLLSGEDGIIGPNTLLYLMAPTITEPRLALDRAEEG